MRDKVGFAGGNRDPFYRMGATQCHGRVGPGHKGIPLSGRRRGQFRENGAGNYSRRGGVEEAWLYTNTAWHSADLMGFTSGGVAGIHLNFPVNPPRHKVGPYALGQRLPTYSLF